MSQTKQKNQANKDDCPHICEQCNKLCEEAKTNVVKLQKTVLAMTIVCTAAITILGEKGIESLNASLNEVKKATEITDGSNSETVDKNKNTDQADGIPNQPSNKNKDNTKNQTNKDAEKTTKEKAKLPEKVAVSVINGEAPLSIFTGLKPEIPDFKDDFPQVVLGNREIANLNLHSILNTNFIGYRSDYFGSVYQSSYDTDVYYLKPPIPSAGPIAGFVIFLPFFKSRKRFS